MTMRPLDRPGARMLNHLELVYAPGERALARALLEGLGLRVLDPRTDPITDNLGPAAAPYLIVYVDPRSTDVFDNVIYASEVRPEQWSFERALRERIAGDAELGALHRGLAEAYAGLPQAMTHIGIAYPSAAEVAAALSRLRDAPELEGRVTLSDVFVPGGSGSVDDRVVQGFVYTDVISTGLLLGGQQLELQVRLDGG
jgi:hypothetical protein